MFGKREVNTSKDTRERTIHISKQEMEVLDAGPEGVFRGVFMAAIQQGLFAGLYSALGRPNYPVDIIIGILVLSTYLGVSEKVFLHDLKYSVNWQYALCMDIFCEKLPSQRTLIRFRARCILNYILTGKDVFHEQAVLVANAFREALELKTDYLRIDSVLLNIKAKTRNRSQLLYYLIQGVVYHLANTSRSAIGKMENASQQKINEVFGTGTTRKLVDFEHGKTDEKARAANIPEQLWHYLYPDDYNRTFYERKEYKNKVEQILKDATLLWSVYHESLKDVDEFKVFARALYEQCEWVTNVSKNKGGEYSSKRILRFKCSNAERDSAKKTFKEHEKLLGAFLKAQKKYDTVTKQLAKVKTELAKAESKLEKAQKRGKDTERYRTALENCRNSEKTKQDAQELTSEELENAREAYISSSLFKSECESYILSDENTRKEVEKMNSNILQCPQDPDATFREKNGQFFRGYTLCVLEAADHCGHSMPVDWITEKNNVSDCDLGTTLIRNLRENVKETGKEIYVVADAAFSGAQIDEAAKEANVTIVNTDLTGKKEKTCYANLVFNGDGTSLEKCPAGHKVETRSCDKNGLVSAVLESSHCKNCPYNEECNPTVKGEKAILKASFKQKLRAQFRVSMGEMPHIIIGRFRNGVEALMHTIRSLTSVTKYPIYGQNRVAFYDDCTMMAVCFQKYLAQRNLPHRYVEVCIDASRFGEDDLFEEELEQGYLEKMNPPQKDMHATEKGSGEVTQELNDDNSSADVLESSTPAGDAKESDDTEGSTYSTPEEEKEEDNASTSRNTVREDTSSTTLTEGEEAYQKERERGSEKDSEPQTYELMVINDSAPEEDAPESSDATEPEKATASFEETDVVPLEDNRMDETEEKCETVHSNIPVECEESFYFPNESTNTFESTEENPLVESDLKEETVVSSSTSPPVCNWKLDDSG